MKCCPRCKKELGEDAFRTQKPRPSRRGKLHGYCIPCERAYKCAWVRKNPAYRERQRVRQRRGVTDEQVKALLASQNYMCAICRTKEPGKKGWNLDHDHKTGKNRGMLCHNCNRGLGYFKDSPVKLLIASQYLRRHGCFQ